MSELIENQDIAKAGPGQGVRAAGNSALPSMQIAAEPMQLIQMAVQNGASVESLTQLLALKEKWEAGEARKAFVSAMAQFKSNPPKITKNRKVKFTTQKGTTEYTHASLDHVCDIIGAALGKVNISYRWETEQLDGGLVKVRCILTHALGHQESSVLIAQPDNSGNKNGIQAVGSTVTYLQRYTLLAVTGMATEDQDDDGRGAGVQAQTITQEQAANLAALGEEVKANMSQFLKYLKVEKLEDLPAVKYDSAIKALEGKRKQ